MDVYEAIRGRSTTGAYAPEVPPREVVERLIDVSIWAPNHRLTEPWRFTAIAGAERDAFGRALAEWLEAGGHGEAVNEEDVRRARGSMLSAPVIVAVSQVAAEADPVRDLEDYAACCCVVQNLMLAAHAEGLASKWMTGRLSRYAGARELLGLGERDRIVGYVCLGYRAPDAEVTERERLPPPVEWRGW